MSLYQKAYERALKRYDESLFVQRNADGVLCVFKHSKRFMRVCEAEGYRLLNLVKSKEYVFALTDTWGINGKPRDYGVDDVVDHLKKIDSLANARFLEEAEERNAQSEKSKKRALRNEMEAFWSHERNRFKRAIDESVGTTTSLDKSDRKKRLRDRRIKNG